MKPTNFYFSLKTFVLLAAILTCSKVHSQTQNDTILASRYYKKADSLLKNNSYKESIILFKKAIYLYEKTESWEKVTSCYNKISKNLLAHYNKNALHNAQKALEISTKYLEKNNREEANAYDNIGKYHTFVTSDYEKALQQCKKALSIRSKTLSENDKDFIKSYSNLGFVYLYQKNYNASLDHFKKALEIGIHIYGENHINITEHYTDISRVYITIDEHEKFRYYTEKTLNIRIQSLEKDHSHIGYAYANLGVSYHLEKYYDKALKYYKKALAIHIKNYGKYTIDVARSYNNLGLICRQTGNYDKALQYQKKALSIFNRLIGKNRNLTADTYNNIAVILEHKEKYDEALEYYEKSLSIYKKNDPEVEMVYLNMGDVFYAKKEYNKALEYYEKSLATRSTKKKIANANVKIGRVYISKKQYNKALAFLRKVLNSRTSVDSNYTSNLILIGNIFEKKKEYSKALSYYNKAIDANKRTNTKTKITDHGKFDEFLNLNFLLTTYNSIGKTLNNKYQEDKDIKDLISSQANNKHADSLIDKMRQMVDSYTDKIEFAKKSQEMYNLAIKTSLLMYKESKEDQFLEEAFYYSEKNKSNILKELLNESKIKNVSGLSPQLIELEKDLKTNRAFYQSKITKEQFKPETDTSKILKYESKIFDITRRQDSIKAVIQKKHPKYYQLKHQNKVISVTELQQKLDKRTTVLEFFTTDSITYAFTISKNNIDINTLQTPRLAQKIKQLHDAITSTNLIKYKKSAHILYNELIAPIANKFKGDHLIIIPDGPLWTLNFELLLTQNDTSDNAKKLSYFLKDYAISYANSAHLLFTPFKKKQRSKIKEECLAFSFSDSTTIANTSTMRLATFRDIVDDLPGTREEIRAISNIIDGQYYFGSQATERNFKKTASQYNILHLAMHGEVDNENPKNSKLYFTQSKDSIEDNILYSHELFALDIPAELTVLSACETGSGKIAKGEGIMSLGNAFQYAGTKSLLLTSWKISDKTTPKLMSYFYTNLKNGMTKSKALQQAKLKYLNTSDTFYSDPLYWGGFYLVGDTTPIPFSNNNTLYWIIGFIILGILLLSLLLYKRKLNRISQ